ncbi:GroES-like protein [Trametopsis cervina]|nr:GroES-like protein [Trametopsis cervina]
MSHQALIIPAPGSPFELGSRPTPKPGPGEVLIKNVTVGLSRVDTMIQTMGLFVDQGGFPTVAGCEGAGVIEAVGEGVESWKKGDRVLYESFWSPDRMSFQEFTIANGGWISESKNTDKVMKIPPEVSFEEAATIPVGFTTAAVGLYHPRTVRGGIALTAPWETDGKGKYSGQPAIVIGGSSSVGQFALQLLKASGFSPIITTASKSNEAYCKAAGATHVIDYHDVPYEELPAAVKKITSLPVPVVYEATPTPESQKACLEILAPNGGYVTTTPVNPEIGKTGEATTDGKWVVWPFGSAVEGAHLEFGKHMFLGLTDLLKKGDLKPNKVEVVPRGLAGTTDGLLRVLQGVSGVKLVANISQTEGEIGVRSFEKYLPPIEPLIRAVYPVGTSLPA